MITAADCDNVRHPPRLQADIKAKDDELSALKTQLEIQSGGRIEEVSTLSDRLGIKVAKAQGALEAAKDDLNVRMLLCAAGRNRPQSLRRRTVLRINDTIS
jgi:hypothetical protein